MIGTKGQRGRRRREGGWGRKEGALVSFSFFFFLVFAFTPEYMRDGRFVYRAVHIYMPFVLSMPFLFSVDYDSYEYHSTLRILLARTAIRTRLGYSSWETFFLFFFLCGEGEAGGEYVTVVAVSFYYVSFFLDWISSAFCLFSCCTVVATVCLCISVLSTQIGSRSRRAFCKGCETGINSHLRKSTTRLQLDRTASQYVRCFLCRSRFDAAVTILVGVDSFVQ